MLALSQGTPPDQSPPGCVVQRPYRLQCAPGRIAHLTGLAPLTRVGCKGYTPASALLYLIPDTAAQFPATNLSQAEVSAMRMDQEP